MRRWMLADGKNKGIVDGKSRALGLHDVQVMTLSMRCWVAQYKIVWRIFTGVNDGYGKCKGMRNVSAGLHNAPFTCVDLYDTLSFVAW